MKIYIVTAIIMMAVTFYSHAQYDSTYVLKEICVADCAKEIFGSREGGTLGEYDDMYSKRILDVNMELNLYLIDMAEKGSFYASDTISRYTNQVMRELASNAKLEVFTMGVLIAWDSEVNAFSPGQGSVVLNNGLLAQLTTEEELAFVIAHELAHIELDHVLTSIKNIERIKAEIQNLQKAYRKSLLKYDVYTLALTDLREEFYEMAEKYREQELAADSLGYLIYKETYANKTAPLELIELLDIGSNGGILLGDRLLDDLYFEEYPLQIDWLKGDLSVYAREPDHLGSGLFEVGKVSTHPFNEKRIVALKQLIAEDVEDGGKRCEVGDSLAMFSEPSLFENVHSLYKAKSFDKALYAALQLKSIYPNNSYLSQMIGQVLWQVALTKKSGEFDRFFNRWTYSYSEELRLVSNLVRNIDSEQAMYLSYHFMKHSGNFDIHDRSHYELLSELCKAMGKKAEHKQLRQRYKVMFSESL
ncbi:M48 family metallopeptidase [Reichenbachiella sp. MSK19-1]|uniref:M48 family metallopeptidase n=1 Tax=Reichenbachiella sp. MSK19-1 TaxID=1897631 RepID=UPI0011C45E88|nr:M48 family metallopeptidase [Reichenbachiella sp. MSK19-1]